MCGFHPSLFAPSLFFKEQGKWFFYGCSLRRAPMSDSLLEENESLFRSFTYKKKQFAQKPKERIFNPGN